MPIISHRGSGPYLRGYALGNGSCALGGRLMAADGDVMKLRPEAATWVAENGETVLLDLDRAWYLGVNRSGTILWLALADGATRAELIGRLRGGYDIPIERAEADVDAFVEICRERGLLQ